MVCASITITVGLISLLLFGDTLQENILLNIATIPSTLSLILRILFSAFVASLIPYCFFPFKQACLVLIYESLYKSISEKLDAKRVEFLSRDPA